VRTVYLVGPATVADPMRPSGGNTYHRMVAAELARLDWTVRERLVESEAPPNPRPGWSAAVSRTLESIPDGAVVLLDGLVTSDSAAVVAAHGERLRLVLVVHLPHGLDPDGTGRRLRRESERAVLDAVAAVVTTSRWTRDWLADTYAVEPAKLRVASPGVEPASAAVPTEAGGRLLCVGAVTDTKAQDTLVDALAATADLVWSCRCVGSLDVDPDFAARVRDRAESHGLGDRVTFTGPLVGEALAAEYAAADLLVLASRTETYGLVVSEALARAVPALAPAVGGLPEAMGSSPDGRRPGLLVDPDDVGALAAGLRAWLTDSGLRDRLRSAAAARRPTLPGWADTARRLSDVLTEVAA
jgi:glycosyltransferase involved in cell wall biosynthesis